MNFKRIYILLFIGIIGLVFSLCKPCNKNIIDTYALVVPNDFHGDIIIFFEQDFNKGKIEFEKCKHFFYVENDGVFFTTLKSGEGFFEFYDEKLNLKDYYSTMHIKDAPSSSFQVIGGDYRGLKIDQYKNGQEWCRFIIFKSGITKDIQNNWFVSDSTIAEMYKNSRDKR